jgi:hypothetical protein
MNSNTLPITSRHHIAYRILCHRNHIEPPSVNRARSQNLDTSHHNNIDHQNKSTRPTQRPGGGPSIHVLPIDLYLAYTVGKSATKIQTRRSLVSIVQLPSTTDKQRLHPPLRKEKRLAPDIPPSPTSHDPKIPRNEGIFGTSKAASVY